MECWQVTVTICQHIIIKKNIVSREVMDRIVFSSLIGHVRYINIPAWLRGFRVKIAKFSSFLCPSIPKRDLDTKKTTPNIEVWPESLWAMLEYWYIERGLLPLMECWQVIVTICQDIIIILRTILVSTRNFVTTRPRNNIVALLLCLREKRGSDRAALLCQREL